MADEAPKRRAVDRSRLGRGFITISSVTVVGIMFNIISGVSHQAQTSVDLANQQGAAIIQIREDFQANVELYALELAEISGMVAAMREEISTSTDDRFRGKDFERERLRLIEFMEARITDLQHQIDQLGRGMAALHSDDNTLVRGSASGD